MSSNHPAIRVSHLSKQYKLGGREEPYHTLRDAIVNSLKAPMKIFHKAPPVEGFWALKDVSFEVEPGEVVGISGGTGPDWTFFGRCDASGSLYGVRGYPGGIRFQFVGDAHFSGLIYRG